jgi:hypothetical protein
MKESYGEGGATHTGPESCVGARKGDGEALTGERTGRVSTRERANLRDADALGAGGRPHRARRYRETNLSRGLDNCKSFGWPHDPRSLARHSSLVTGVTLAEVYAAFRRLHWFQQLFFPDGIVFDGKRFVRTVVTAPALQLLAAD